MCIPFATRRVKLRYHKRVDPGSKRGSYIRNNKGTVLVLSRIQCDVASEK